MSSSLCVSQQDYTAESLCKLKIYPDGRKLGNKCFIQATWNIWHCLSMFSNISPWHLQRVSESEIKVQRACRELEVEKVVVWTIDLPFGNLGHL